jgi:creatine kinase
VACGTVVYHNFTSIELKPLQAAGINTSRKYYPASAEYPDLTKNRSIMARHMTKQLYAQLRDQFTPNGFTIDDAIQTGVDNVGKFSFTGIVAGDEQSYKAITAIKILIS